MEIKKRNLNGWKRSLPDQRDLLFSKHFATQVILPRKVDLREKCSAVENQQELGSCTANAAVDALELLENLYSVDKFEDLSRIYVYYKTRLLEGTVSYDSGCTVRNTIKALKKWGACTEKLLPYNITKFTRKPPKICDDDAKNHIITGYYSVRSVLEMKTALANNLPVLFGATLYESFDGVGPDGMVPMPSLDDGILGGHCMFIVGFLEDLQVFIVKNSWGTEFGDGGYCYMPYKYIGNRDLVDDCWVITKAKFS